MTMAEAPSAPRRRPVILLVEDGPVDAVWFRTLLDSRGEDAFDLIVADTLGTAVSRLASGSVDLVVLDLGLPDSEGIESLRRVRAVDAEVPIVVLTGRDDADLGAQAIREGAQDYLVKARIQASSLHRVIGYSLERNQALRRLRELDRLRSRFVSMASHEIRTPLTIIREFASLLGDEITGPVTSDQRECLDTIVRNCDRLDALVGDVLDLSRIEQGGLTIARSSVDLRALLGQCARELASRCHGKSQTLELDVSPDLPSVLCDPDRIYQVLLNLGVNAHKFTPVGGRLVLRATPLAGTVRVEVEDEGIGIAPEDRDRVFEAFGQVDRPGAALQGSGLGLTICKHLIELHGASLDLDSAPGRGSRFSFSLPAYAPGAEIRAFLEERGRRARRDGRALTVAALRVSTDGANDRLAPLRRLQTVSRGVLRHRADDDLLVVSEGLLLLALAADPDGSRAALRRIADAAGAAEANDFRYALLDPTRADAVDPLRGLPFRPVRTAGRRVLIVDDEPALLAWASRALSELDPGLLVRATSSGYEACIEYGGFEPDVVVLDVNMPEMDGREVLRSMMSSARIPRVRFVGMSGSPEALADLAALGCHAGLRKPFGGVELERAIRAQLDAALDRPADARIGTTGRFS